MIAYYRERIAYYTQKINETCSSPEWTTTSLFKLCRGATNSKADIKCHSALVLAAHRIRSDVSQRTAFKDQFQSEEPKLMKCIDFIGRIKSAYDTFLLLHIF